MPSQPPIHAHVAFSAPTYLIHGFHHYISQIIPPPYAVVLTSHELQFVHHNNASPSIKTDCCHFFRWPDWPPAFSAGFFFKIQTVLPHKVPLHYHTAGGEGCERAGPLYWKVTYYRCVLHRGCVALLSTRQLPIMVERQQENTLHVPTGNESVDGLIGMCSKLFHTD